MDGDGARTAQAIPPLLGAVGTIAGLSGLKVTKGMSLAAKMDVRINLARNFIKKSRVPEIERHLAAIHLKNLFLLKHMERVQSFTDTLKLEQQIQNITSSPKKGHFLVK